MKQIQLVGSDLYDFWVQMIQMQNGPWAWKHWETFRKESIDGTAPRDWDFANNKRWLPSARLHERNITLRICGEYNGEPILGLCREHNSNRAYYGNRTVLFLIYPDGTFLMLDHARYNLRCVARHTFIATFRYQHEDLIHLEPSHTGVSWVSIRDWRVRKPYFAINTIPTYVPWRVQDDRLVIVDDDIKDLAVRYGGEDGYREIIARGQERLQQSYDRHERRYKLHHRKWARGKGLPDPYAVVSPRRQAKIAQITQLINPYTPARSALLKPIPQREPQAQGGQQ